ncbi:hypothetical protein BDY24DRAFT_382716 [Mrakia frigida]|uniref:zinc finger MYND domain-containing protein n=1 Tax=Mrakia frigida TaxID=29902 RepID=UPI003FCC0280
MNRVHQDLGNLQIVLRGCYEHEECSRYRDEFRASLCWWNCEGRGLGKCRKLKKGAEMMACGRCKAVRYCSPEHQKAHWKSHKKTCRTPIW